MNHPSHHLRGLLSLACACILLAASPAVLAQSADVEFPSGYASSSLHIQSNAIAGNGTRTPISYDPATRYESQTSGVIITSVPIVVQDYRSLVIDLHSATTISRDDPKSSKGLLTARVEIVDAETGRVLLRKGGVLTMMERTKPGDDTSASQSLSIDLTGMQTRSILFRVIGVCWFSNNATPRVTINNTPMPAAGIVQVH